MTHRYKGHLIMLEREERDGTTAIRYTITSDTGMGAAVGSEGWFFVGTLKWAALECERIIESAIAGEKAKLAAGMVC